MCSYNTKGRARLETGAEGEAEKVVAWADKAEAKIAKNEVTSKCNGITTLALH